MKKLYRSVFAMASVDYQSPSGYAVIEGDAESANQACTHNVPITPQKSHAPRAAILMSLNLLTS
jgi:hypothetical protein